jgi:excisionase family DNA binding protein
MKAAKVADVHRRTIYRYVESGEIYHLKVAGKTTRVCSGCLLKREEMVVSKNQ